MDVHSLDLILLPIVTPQDIVRHPPLPGLRPKTKRGSHSTVERYCVDNSSQRIGSENSAAGGIVAAVTGSTT